MSGLAIRSDAAIDFLSLGAIVHRLDPGVIPFNKATECRIHVSGGEFNCAANLSDCFGLKTGIVTAMVDYPIGDLIAERVRAMGVQPFYTRFAHDGVTGPNMATVYSDRGHGVRAPVVFYNRANEAAAQLRPGQVKWKDIFSRGVKWFHSGGIFASLSESTGELIVEGMIAAREAGAVTSFDLNYRQKLWSTWGGGSRAQSVLRRIVEHVDVLIGSEHDVEHRLGVSLADTARTYALDPTPFFAMTGALVEEFPSIQAVATTLRDVHSANHHSWGAAAWIGGANLVSPSCELDVLDRVGSGDGFASGFFYGLLTGEDPQSALNFGWAHGALLTTYPGDTTMATLEQVRAVANGASARIQR